VTLYPLRPFSTAKTRQPGAAEKAEGKTENGAESLQALCPVFGRQTLTDLAA
jgi:hypothetical protein